VQDAQISGSMTGSHVDAIRSNYLLTQEVADHEIGVSFLLVHFLWTSKENFVHECEEAANPPAGAEACYFLSSTTKL